MIGPQDVWVALGLMVFFFGAKKLPELSRSLGQALSEFKKGLADSNDQPRSSEAQAARPEAPAEDDVESRRLDRPA
jgi:TatA/E family protein of Tat protein translocase